MYQTLQEILIVTFAEDEKNIKHLIRHATDYRTIDILLNKRIGARLAEYEYALSGIIFLELAIHHGYVPLHASAFTIGQHTILLSGPSQTGKSTQTRYFKELNKQFEIINEDEKVVGMIQLRHHIDHPVLSTWGGHIGYSVAPSERRKGYANEMLRLCVLEEKKTRNTAGISNL